MTERTKNTTRTVSQFTEDGVKDIGYNYISWPSNELGVVSDSENSSGELLGDGIRYPHICAFFINENVRDLSNGINRSRGVTTSEVSGGNTESSSTAKVITNRISNTGFSTSTEQFAKAANTVIGAANAVSGKISEAIGSNTTAPQIKTLIAPTYKRLNLAIFLPMPMQIRHGYDVQYNEAGLQGVWGTAITAINNDTLANAASASLGQFVRGTLSRIAESAGAAVNVGSEENNRRVVNRFLGSVENPRTEQVFEKVGIREFTFRWVFYPKSVEETNDLRTILDLFKENMLPAFRSDDNIGGIYTMPNEFDIEFYKAHKTGGVEEFKENTYIPRISTCVLTSLNIDSTPHSQFTAFEGTGAPTSIGVEMTFKELSPLHRDMVGKTNTTTRKGGH